MKMTKVSGILLKVAVMTCFVPLLMGCGLNKKLTKQYPIEKEKTILMIRDSLRIRDTLIYIRIPKEYVRVVCPVVDTLNMETSVAKARVYLDTASLKLKGTLKNKPIDLEKNVKIVYKDKIVEKEVVKEIPIVHEVVKEVNKIPKWTWYSIAVNAFLIFGLIILLKLK